MSGESGPCFVDTNILVYAYDPTAGAKYECARDLVSRLWNRREGCLSTQVLQEFYVTVTRKLARPLGSEEASGIVSDLSEWTIHRPTVSTILAAVRIETRHHISFWDALIVASASELGCTTIWSEDLNPGQVYETVAVANPLLR
jgi:predicted nucleic acid-binding protein